MKILILGTGKTGTTAMVYKVAGGLPNCRAFSGGQPGTYVGDYKNAVYKHTYDERKGKSFDVITDHLKNEHYDRKIWMIRDPRDTAVSRMLYRWHRGARGNRKQYQAHLDLILRKEKDPGIPLVEICRYATHGGWPCTREDVVEDERQRYQHIHTFVDSLKKDWFLFTFEDMVANRFDALNEYLGFQVKADAGVPSASGKAKVIRKKAAGDWRDWFTEEDVTLFKPVFTPYMKLVGYDCDDWTLNSHPVIEPEYSSVYVQNLARKAGKNRALRFFQRIAQHVRKQD